MLVAGYLPFSRPERASCCCRDADTRAHSWRSTSGVARGAHCRTAGRAPRELVDCCVGLLVINAVVVQGDGDAAVDMRAREPTTWDGLEAPLLRVRAVLPFLWREAIYLHVQNQALQVVLRGSELLLIQELPLPPAQLISRGSCCDPGKEERFSFFKKMSGAAGGVRCQLTLAHMLSALCGSPDCGRKRCRAAFELSLFAGRHLPFVRTRTSSPTPRRRAAPLEASAVNQFSRARCSRCAGRPERSRGR